MSVCCSKLRIAVSRCLVKYQYLPTQSTLPCESRGTLFRVCLQQSLLSLRKQQAVASLAFSCDWLSHKLLKICVAIKHQSLLTPSDGHSSHLGSKNSPRRTIDFDGHTSNSDGATASAQKLRQIGRKLAQLADDSLLCLRLEVIIAALSVCGKLKLVSKRV